MLLPGYNDDMSNQKGSTALIIMISAAVVFLAIGFLVVRQRTKSEPAPNPANQETSQTPQEPTNNQELTPPAGSVEIAGWKTYANTKYNYQVQYPPNLKVGSISGNSVLGTYDAPVRGYDVGPLVLITLTGSLRTEATAYFNEYYNLAQHPVTPSPGEPAVFCAIDQMGSANSNVLSVSCIGEGGAARYALIRGTDYDIFVDGYSKGFDNSDNGEFQTETDYVKVLSTFKFNSATQAQAPSPAPSPTPTPTVQSFSITADDSSANPSQITVPIGTIVNLTFNVSSQNVYYGGLEFRSLVANTGTIQAGGSKTIAFTVNQSFEFTPYWPASGVAKDYKIKIIAQ